MDNDAIVSAALSRMRPPSGAELGWVWGLWGAAAFVVFCCVCSQVQVATARPPQEPSLGALAVILFVGFPLLATLPVLIIGTINRKRPGDDYTPPAPRSTVYGKADFADEMALHRAAGGNGNRLPADSQVFSD